MSKEIISSKQGITIMSMFVIGSTFVVGSSSYAKQDTWIAVLLGISMAIPAVIIYARLTSLFPGRNLFDISEIVFGKFIGNVITIIYTWYAFHLGSMVARNFSEFIQVVSMPETPQTLLLIFVGLITIYMVKSGIEVLGRWTEFVLPVLYMVSAVTISLSLSSMKIINIKPVLFNGIQPVLGSAFLIFSFPFAETVIFTMILSSLAPKANVYKVYLLSLFLGGIFILISTVRNILVLGFPSASNIYFPSYAAVSLINIGDFLQRLEVIVSIIFLLCGIVKTSVCLLAATKGVAKILNIEDDKLIVAPIGLLMLNLSCILYSSTMEMFEWAAKIYSYYAIPFQIVLPLIIYIGAEIKKGRSVDIT